MDEKGSLSLCRSGVQELQANLAVKFSGFCASKEKVSYTFSLEFTAAIIIF